MAWFGLLDHRFDTARGTTVRKLTTWTAQRCAALIWSAILLLWPLNTRAVISSASVTLAWDPSSDYVAGYVVYAVEVGGTNVNTIAVVNKTTARLDALSVDKTYLIYATAVTGYGLESLPGGALIYSPGLPSPPGGSTPPEDIPIITQQPVANTTQVAGDRLILSVSVQAFGPVSYQWIHDGAPVRGATTDTLVVPATTVNDSGTYTVFVGYTDVAVLSSEASVLVTPAPVDSHFELDGTGPLHDEPFTLQVSSVLSTWENESSAPAPVTIGLAPVDADAVTFTVESSDPELVSPDQVLLGGNGDTRFIVVVPAPNRSGTAQLTLTAHLGDQKVERQLRCVVMPTTGLPPRIIGLPDQLQLASGQRVSVPFIADDSDGGSAFVTVNSTPGGLPIIVNTDPVTLGRSLIITPDPTQVGAFEVSVTAESFDGIGTVELFSVQVIAPTLRIERTSTSLLVFWPNVPGLSLHVATDLNSGWIRSPDVPAVIGTDLQATFPLQEQARFFRLTVE